MKKIFYIAATLPFISGCTYNDYFNTSPPSSPSSKGSLAISNVSLDSSNKVGMSTAKANGDNLIYNPQTNVLTVNGIQPSSYKMASMGKLTDGTYPIGVVYGTYTDGNINKSFAGTIDQTSALNLSIEKHSTATWKWKDVNYGYTTATGSNAPTDHTAAGHSGTDGVITANLGANPQWNATFGDVKLSGTVTGSTVSGSAVLDDMNGVFSGIDGSSIKFGSVNISNGVTTGGFAGDNGGDSSFAGGWFGFKP